MTKQAYFEMCEMLKTEPVDSDIPVSMDDLPPEVQYTFHVYRTLRDEFDPMSGKYIGKSLIGIADIFDILEVDKQDRYITLLLIQLIDSVRRDAINKETSQDTPATPKA